MYGRLRRAGAIAGLSFIYPLVAFAGRLVRSIPGQSAGRRVLILFVPGGKPDQAVCLSPESRVVLHELAHHPLLFVRRPVL
jgi:hypothetical protein